MSEEKTRSVQDQERYKLPKDLLANNRPPQVREKIELRTKFARTGQDEPWRQLGYFEDQEGSGKRYYFHNLAGADLTSVDIISIELQKKDRLSVLDIGAAAGEPIRNIAERFGDKVDASALSLHDYRKAFSWAARSIGYRVGNAEELLAEYSGKKFDVIFCVETAYEFVDPVGTIEQIYEALTPGGVMIIKTSSGGLQFPGFEGKYEALVRRLQHEGIKVAAQYYYDGAGGEISIAGYETLVIRKSEKSLSFPAEYDRDSVLSSEGVANYKPERKVGVDIFDTPRSMCLCIKRYGEHFLEYITGARSKLNHFDPDRILEAFEAQARYDAEHHPKILPNSSNVEEYIRHVRAAFTDWYEGRDKRYARDLKEKVELISN